MPTDAIRKPLREQLAVQGQLQPGQHVGLMLDRFLPQHDDEHTGAKQLYDLAQQTEVSPVYKSAFSRWRQSLQRLEGVRLFTATAASPIAVGLGNESVLEVGLTVHRTYGVPIIPGSALKGLCRRGALRLRSEGKLTDEQFRVLFGYSDDNGRASAGYIVFWDAWYDPESVQGKPFHRDTITVHHADYYTSRGQAYPTDFDDPNPVPFLVVRPGARFLFAVQSPDDGWGAFAQNLLQWCLQNLGVGAKTNAGYGYFTLDEGKVDTSPARQHHRRNPSLWTPPQIHGKTSSSATIRGSACYRCSELSKDAAREPLPTPNAPSSCFPHCPKPHGRSSPRASAACSPMCR
jgi:CRISPR-associated protein Cmr6